ncbi:hypothetical protein HanRHA438_Chr06g0259481 [Helianthus annuus]|nr:hypothetical protein HanIR_Chr06g0269191 [Helianthus annuus]KAJ0911095.1 hypothetical protein HanRHA438_Chr06g0259481 [Helianthus annuus]
MCNTSGSLSGRSLSLSCAAHEGKSVILNTPPPSPSQSDIHTYIHTHKYMHTRAPAHTRARTHTHTHIYHTLHTSSILSPLIIIGHH